MFPHFKRVPFKLRYCSIFKVLCAAPSRVGSSFIISREVLFVKHFFEIFSSRFSAPCPLKGCPIILPLHHPNVNTFFQVFSSFLQRAVLRFLLYYIQSTSGPEIFRFKIKHRYLGSKLKKHLPSGKKCGIILSAPVKGCYASVAQLDRAFGSDNSDRQLGAAEKPHNEAIFRHRVPRFYGSLTTI